MPSRERLQASKLYEEAFQEILQLQLDELGYERIEKSKPNRKDHFGKLSKTWRQIDATIHLSGEHLPGEELVLVDCKHYKRKVTIKTIEEFDAMVRLDLGYKGAMIVSCVGFSKPAINYAKARDIGLVTLNSAATKIQYIMRMEDHNLRIFLNFVGFSDALEISDQAVYGAGPMLGDNLKISSEGSMRSTNP